MEFTRQQAMAVAGRHIHIVSAWCNMSDTGGLFTNFDEIKKRLLDDFIRSHKKPGFDPRKLASEYADKLLPTTQDIMDELQS